MADETQTRVDGGIVEMWRKDGRLYAIAGFLVGVMIFALIGLINETGEIRTFLESLVPEVIGIGVTVFVIDRWIRKRDAENALVALKRQLIDDAASVSNEIAKNGVHQLWRKGWLHGEGGLLQGADLTSASLQGAILMRANLRYADLRTANLQWANLGGVKLHGADLRGAKLQRADLNWAHLEGANMTYARLQGSYLWWAHLENAQLESAKLQRAQLNGSRLQGANLVNADLLGTELERADLSGAQLEGADLRKADLRGANLLGADLKDAKLEDAILDERTKLPDGSYWVSGTVTARFTDLDYEGPNGEKFWRSDDPESPAYRGKSEE